MTSMKDICRFLLQTDATGRFAAEIHDCSHNTASRYKRRLLEEGITVETLEALSEQDLDARINNGRLLNKKAFVEPDWNYVHTEMHKPTVDLLGIYTDEYLLQQGLLMSYSEFGRRYRKFLRSLGLVMRQVHTPGMETFIDFSGRRPEITDPRTGQATKVELFVAAMGCSRKYFVYAVETQQLRDFVTCHVEMMTFYGRASMFWVPDNLKSAISNSNRKNLLINPTYGKVANHYGVYVHPTRARKPKDKAPVELAVKIVQRFILRRLRNRVFYSLAELNRAIRELLSLLNDKPMKTVGGKSRNQLFQELDLPRMRPLPSTPYEYAEWKIDVRVGIDYHIKFENRHYSVPYRLVGERVNIKATDTLVIIYHREQQVACHKRAGEQGTPSTAKEHMPVRHQSYSRDQIPALLEWAKGHGGALHDFLQLHLQEHNHSPSFVQSACSLQKLCDQYGPTRVAAACQRASRSKPVSIASVRSILESGLEDKPLPAPSSDTAIIGHENIRGEDYYH